MQQSQTRRPGVDNYSLNSKAKTEQTETDGVKKYCQLWSEIMTAVAATYLERSSSLIATEWALTKKWELKKLSRLSADEDKKFKCLVTTNADNV